MQKWNENKQKYELYCDDCKMLYKSVESHLRPPYEICSVCVARRFSDMRDCLRKLPAFANNWEGGIAFLNDNLAFAKEIRKLLLLPSETPG